MSKESVSKLFRYVILADETARQHLLSSVRPEDRDCIEELLAADKQALEEGLFEKFDCQTEDLPEEEL